MNRFFNEALLIDFLKITLAILGVIILYRLLLRYLSRKHVKKELYCTLFEVEDQPVSGEIPFYFTTQLARNVELFIETELGVRVATVTQETYEIGGHLLRFDSTSLENGTYFYVLMTENQEIRKKIIVQN
jgi:hypothetical protein